MRTEDDTWDITTSVGTTAIGVAVMRAVETSRSDAVFRDPYAELLVKEAGTSWGRLLDPDDELRDKLDKDGEHSHLTRSGFMVARTWWLDQQFAEAIAAGVRQFVILASGLDARAYRLTWPDDAVVFEIDQPKVLEFKTSVLARHHVTPAVEHHTVPIDLRRDWATPLVAAGLRPDRPTLWLAEGLLRYLPAEAQDRLFDTVLAHSAPGSRFAANFGSWNHQLSDAERASRQALERALGLDIDIEALVYSHENRSDPADWFTAHGWRVTTSDAESILTELGRPTPESASDRMRQFRLVCASAS